jgi:3'-phosphoadenosine 5'-phosphosulfate sulfotransferase (PAPS reductase)/FAD synthetase
MLEFREWAIKQYGINVIVKVNTEARARGIGYETHDPVTVTHELKTAALKQALAEHKWDALITGIRRDEDPTRAKERYFSPRDADSEWHYKHQPPQFWGQFAIKNAPGEHVRVQPLLDWTEVDIWRYIQREQIPIPPLYFARDGKRYRSLGCTPITHPKQSSLNWKPPAQASGPAAPRTITNRTRCKSSAPEDSCENCFRWACRSWEVDLDWADPRADGLAAGRKTRRPAREL